MSKDCFELCEGHDNSKIFYDYGLRCPLCDAEGKISELEEKIEDMEEAANE